MFPSAQIPLTSRFRTLLVHGSVLALALTLGACTHKKRTMGPGDFASSNHGASAPAGAPQTASPAAAQPAPASTSAPAAVNPFPRDKSAKKSMDDAINNLYLMQRVREAESQLLGIYAACEDRCSPAVKARAWMYVGIVRGGGASDQKGAREAFDRAVKEDPTVELDLALATPETQASFDAARGR